MIKQDILGKQAKIVYLGIGSNLGNRKQNIEISKYKLHSDYIKIISVSNYYESLSWPDPNKPKFLNIVLKVKTSLTPQNLLSFCKLIEKDLGRKKSPRNSPRECDIDIIDYNGIISKNRIILPHRLMHKRNFVLIPMYEITKTWKHPKTKENIKKLIGLLSNKDIRSIKQI